MKINDILEHFLSRADWVDRAKTVDRIIAGDDECDADKCLVTWMPEMAALQEAVRRDVKLVITHEPTFWNHSDDRPTDDPHSQEKLRFIQENGLVILRNHDCWDCWPEVGIPWAWGKFLGFTGQPVAFGNKNYQHRYDIEPVSLDALACRVARACGSIGEEMVQATGDGEMMVSKIGIGTGCGCSVYVFQDMGCDCSIVCDDGSCYWRGIQRSKEIGHAVIRVNHGTSEEPGMVTLTEYINQNIPGLTAEHLPHGSTFHLVGE